MSSSITRYLPGLAGRMEPRTQALEDRAASPRDGGTSSSEFTGNIGPAQSLSDEALIALICKGDQEALSSLFRRYARVIRGVALRILKDSSEAEDLLQDIFILIHRLCQTFDSSKGSAQLRSCASIPARRGFPSIGTVTTTDRSTLWSSANTTFALGANCLTVG